ncbi:MAG TPA: enoyl-CoA hydratase-related protein [Pseudonocardiaceae bacterium]|nr:enoyl-CoA hydratase-related protein [Pseudonocardiaceae bacterium]
MTARTVDTGTPDLLAELSDGVLLITLHRPERRNALSDNMLDGLSRMLAYGEREPTVACVVLTGAAGAFCAGGDVKAFDEVGALNVSGGEQTPLHEKIEAQCRLQRATAGRLHDMPKPTIACIDGAAAGAGLGLALACDLRIAAESSVLLTAFARVGLSGDYGVTWFLTRLVGKAKALELMWLSERIPATRALQYGLVNRVTPVGEARSVALSLAADLARGPAVALQAIKGNVNRAVDGDLLKCMDVEVAEGMRCAATEDHKAAVRAFAGNRQSGADRPA